MDLYLKIAHQLKLETALHIRLHSILKRGYTCISSMKRRLLDEDCQRVTKKLKSVHLPDEILLNIFSFLPISSILSARLICKHHNSLICEPSVLWRILDLSQYEKTITVSGFRQMMQYAGNHLHLLRMSFKRHAFAELLQDFEEQKLSLEEIIDICKMGEFVLLENENSDFEIIGRWIDGNAIAEFNPNLRELYLNNACMTQDQLISISQKCQNLKIMHLENYFDIGDESFNSIADHCLQLCDFYLTLSDHSIITEDAFVYFGKKRGQNLEKMMLPNTSSQCLINVLKYCPYLKELITEGAYDDSITEAISKCSLLERLDISDTRMTTGIIKIVKNCKNLKELHATDWIGEDGIKAVIEHAPQLTFLQIIGIFSPLIMEYLCKTLKHLKHLGLCQTSLTKEVLNIITTYLPNLEEFDINHTCIADAEILNNFKNLRLLNISRTTEKTEDKEIEISGEWSTLEVLIFDAERPVDDVLRIVKKFKNLKVVRIVRQIGNSWDKVGMEKLNEFLKSRPRIHFNFVEL